MNERLFELGEALFRRLRADEALLLDYRGESTDFVRLNRNRIRQAGHVRQGTLVSTLVRGRRHVRLDYETRGAIATDLEALTGLLDEQRGQLDHLPEDPHLLYDRQPRESHTGPGVDSVPGEVMTDRLCDLAEGLDLVGILAAGNLERGFLSSLGHRLWHSTNSFHLDWSLFHRADKAVKSDYAGFDWSEDELAARMAVARRDLALMQRPPRTLAPGEYRAYLAPAAVRDLLDMMAWGGFGLKSQRSGQSPLIKMIREGRTLSPAITLSEYPAEGVAPPFTGQGFARPERTRLIEEGRYRDSLVGPRSAKEFGVAVTGAETPDSLDLAPGALAGDELLERLGTGLWINNLWYCNFSDRNACRVTGMTRFACLWVEDGRIVAPVDVMRFDDSIYRLLGEQLLGLTRERRLILDGDTYGGRSTRSYRLPGILVDRMRFTL